MDLTSQSFVLSMLLYSCSQLYFTVEHAPFISLSFHLTHMHLRSLQAPSLTFHKYNFILTLDLAI